MHGGGSLFVLLLTPANWALKNAQLALVAKRCFAKTTTRQVGSAQGRVVAAHTLVNVGLIAIGLFVWLSWYHLIMVDLSSGT
jgi:hypothetical protein